MNTLKDVKRADALNRQCKWQEELEGIIRASIRASLSSSSADIFEDLMLRFQAYYDRPLNNMTVLKKCTKQESGQLWEHFCLMYLHAKGYGQAWLIGDLPDEILEELNLTRKDYGIDIVVKHQNGYFAVQAKWRSNPHKKKHISLTWHQLSTFYALCARTGPWLKYIVMTNCDSVRRVGKKWKMDQTIAKAGFKGCKREVWALLAGLGKGHVLTDTPEEEVKVQPSQDELRMLRIKALAMREPRGN